MAIEPTDAEVIRDAINARLLDVWTATIGRVESYDPKTQTANILPVVRRPLQAADGYIGHEDLPVLPNVPVLQPRAGGFFVHLPLEAGDTVLVVFTADSFQMWRNSGSVTNPGDLRRHSLSNAIAIPGVFPNLEALLDPPNVGMASDEAVLGGGVYRVGDATAAQFVALADKVGTALTTLKAAIDAAATAETGASGLGGMNALKTALEVPPGGWPLSVAATKLKSE